MTRGRIVALLLAVWLLILAIALQPRTHPRIKIEHATPLGRPARELPTLPPVTP